MSAPVVWTCSHGYGFTAFELEMGMTYGTMEFLMALEEREHNLQADIAMEKELARDEAYGLAECPWPWYADSAIEICEPEVFGP